MTVPSSLLMPAWIAEGLKNRGARFELQATGHDEGEFHVVNVEVGLSHRHGYTQTIKVPRVALLDATAAWLGLMWLIKMAKPQHQERP